MALHHIHGVFHVDVKKVTWFAAKDTFVTVRLSIHLMVGGQGQSMRIHRVLRCDGPEDLVLNEDDTRLAQTSVTLDPAKSIAPGVLSLCGDRDPPLRIALVCSRRKGADGELKRETSIVDLSRCTPGSMTLVKVEFSNSNGFFHKQWGEVTLFLRWHTLQDAMTHRLTQLRRTLTEASHMNLYPKSWALASAIVPEDPAAAGFPVSDEALKNLNVLHRSLVGLSRDTFAVAYREQLAIQHRAAAQPGDQSTPSNLWAVEEKTFLKQCRDAAKVCGTDKAIEKLLIEAAGRELADKAESTLTSMLERACDLNDVVSNISNCDALNGVLGDVLQRFLPAIGDALQSIPFCGAIAVVLAALAAAAEKRRDMMSRIEHVSRRLERVYGMLAVPGVPQLMHAHPMRIKMLRDLIKSMERCRLIITEFDRANVLMQLFGNNDTAYLFAQEEKGLDMLLTDLAHDVMVVAIAQHARGGGGHPFAPAAAVPAAAAGAVSPQPPPVVSPRENPAQPAQHGAAAEGAEAGSPLDFAKLHDGVLVEWNEAANRGFIVGPVHHNIAHHTTVPSRQVFDHKALEKRNGAMPVIGTKVQFLCGKGADGCLVASHVTFTDGGPIPLPKFDAAAPGAGGGGGAGLIPVLAALGGKGAKKGAAHVKDIEGEAQLGDAADDSMADAQQAVAQAMAPPMLQHPRVPAAAPVAVPPQQQEVAPCNAAAAAVMVDSSILGTVSTWVPGKQFGFITPSPVGGRQRGPLPPVLVSSGAFVPRDNLELRLQQQLAQAGTLMGIAVIFDWRPSKMKPGKFEAVNCRLDIARPASPQAQQQQLQRPPPPQQQQQAPVVPLGFPAPPVAPRRQQQLSYELLGRVLSWNYCAENPRKSTGTLRPGDDASRKPLSFKWQDLVGDPVVQPVVGDLVLYSLHIVRQEETICSIRAWQ